VKLNNPVTDIPLIGDAYFRKLKRLDIKTVGDLLLHIPTRFLDLSSTSKISEMKLNETATIIGQVISITNTYTKKGRIVQNAVLSDGRDTINIIWFGQHYLVKSISPGTLLSVAGKLGFWGRKKSIISPSFEKLDPGKETIHTGRLVPIYPETAGLTSKWLRSRINFALKNIKYPNEYLGDSELGGIKAISLPLSIKKIHLPKNLKEWEKARRRLGFEELVRLQKETIKKKKSWRKNKPFGKIKIKLKINEFSKTLPFKLTNSQNQAINEILSDLSRDMPMNRLLTGDVGSGKTVVAAAGIAVCLRNNLTSVLLAPTQILAEQHFNSLKKLLNLDKTDISLITSSRKGNPDSKVIIGTHSLLHKSKELRNIGLLIIDEQHRFGVEQRNILAQQRQVPHILTMTATPIPRTVALTLYGDLTISNLTEMPKGRKKITTWIVPSVKRKRAYKWVESEIKTHRTQAFVVCPLITESDKDSMKQVKAATKEREEISKLIPSLAIEVLHGRLPSMEKTKIINKFRKGKINLLVSTPVVEVGIDISNATIMIIEGADRFGLSQLHQLRGRVGRGDKKSYCLLFTESQSEKIITRLAAIKSIKTGRELAEMDLKLRGPGEVFGFKQHGIADLKIAKWTDINLIKQSKKYAEKMPKQSL